MSAVTLSDSVREYTEGAGRMLIGDTWTGAASGETFPVFDPATGTEIACAPWVSGYIDLGRAEGAEIVTGGGRRDDEGWFIEPTVLVDATGEMRVTREGIFGPVLTALPFTDETELLEAANDSCFGLGAAT